MGSRLIDVDKLIDVLRYQPRIGRIARALENKQNPVCFDVVDDIGHLFKSYKKRCATYRKNGCYFVEGGRENDRTGQALLRYSKRAHAEG